MKIEVDRAGAVMVTFGWWTLWLSDDRELAFWTVNGSFCRDVMVASA